jgi:hypothetical protein
MTDVSLEVLNRRTAAAAVHAAAAGIGADADALLDSQAFCDRLTALDPDSPGYRRQVQEMVAGAAGQSSPPKQAVPAQPAAPAGPRQWTLADVDALPSNSEGGRLLNEAIDAGLLVDLGMGPRRKRRG